MAEPNPQTPTKQNAVALQITPNLTEFRELATSHHVIPVRLKVLADSHTPISIYRTLAQGAPGTFLLESAAPGGVWSQHSFIGVRSAATLTSEQGQACWLGDVPPGLPREGTSVDVLEQTMSLLANSSPSGSSQASTANGSSTQGDAAEELPTLSSGMVGFIGWEAVRHWEKLPSPPPEDLGLPELAMNLVSELVVHDNIAGTVLLVSNVLVSTLGEKAESVEGGAQRAEPDTEAIDNAWHTAVERIQEMVKKLQAPMHLPVTSLEHRRHADAYRDDVVERWQQDGYLEAIKLSKEDIVDGEIFQIVISRRFELNSTADPLDIYRILRMENPSPYMFLYNFEDANGADYAIVGSSPEALVTVKDREVVTHPIAGSRPRGHNAVEDQALAEELLADTKERSEHLMLVDLARNDIAKVCVPGTVEVREFMQVERFSHIMHLVSTVVGTLAEGESAYSTLRATFPAGTLSGAPKPRAMQLLDHYEPQRRGLYGGVVGYLDFAGNMDMAITIRAALLKDGKAYVQAGGGIVADSVQEAEALETVNKAAAPLRAVYQAQNLRDL